MNFKSDKSVAVLGAGILGCCVALELACRGVRTVVFDQAIAPMSGASRWNEGKIHLGHLYSASGSTATARRLVPGGLLFKPLLERLLGTWLDRWIAPYDEVYLFHRDSVVSPETSMGYMRAVHDLVLDHPEATSYPGDLHHASPSRLPATDLDRIAISDLVMGGMRVPERSICTRGVADAVAGRVAEEPAIELLMRHRVDGARRTQRNGKSQWEVLCDAKAFGPFDVVVNALWSGRPRIDEAVVGTSDLEPNHRFRVSAFIEASSAGECPSAVIAVGPFGDVKCYGHGRFYASWYNDGLLAAGTEREPPRVPNLDDARRQAIAARIESSVSRILPHVSAIFRQATSMQIEGGWVYAKGRGLLCDPRSTLHSRDQIGFEFNDSYVSIDTGKYSMAPLLARQVCDAILGVA